MSRIVRVAVVLVVVVLVALAAFGRHRTAGPSSNDWANSGGDYFGVSTLTAPQPAGPDGIDAVAQAAGRHPTIIEYFVKWTREFSPGTVRRCYREGALPLLTWEPWAGLAQGSDQPRFALRRIADGDFDAYLHRFAAAVAATRRTVVLRFAQEMNADWFPWSERRSGNQPGDFVRAWRHIHDVFTAQGARNVLWLWSPNVLRGASGELAGFYPGDAYVDWVGLDAYGFGESTAGEVLDPTMSALGGVTGRPVLLAETGARSGPQQAGWTASLFGWLRAHPRVIGFVWFEHSVAEGGRYDYRFTADPATLAAFRSGLASLTLRPWPVTHS
jgi:hypothetical protein